MKDNKNFNQGFCNMQLTEEEIKNYVRKSRAKYTKQYRAEHPDKVERWRKQAILNAYIKLVKAEPQYFIERGEIL